MITQLSTLKSRLGLLDSDTLNDPVLTSGIRALSARFDHECNRTLARTVDAVFEFPADETELAVPGYPIESITRFECKTSEAGGWIEQPEVNFLIRRACVISLASAIGLQLSNAFAGVCRVIYTGGYVLPGAEPLPGQTPLPADLEQAALEQLAYWFQNRERLGLSRIWDYHAAYRQFADLDLLPSVRPILLAHTRWHV